MKTIFPSTNFYTITDYLLRNKADSNVKGKNQTKPKPTLKKLDKLLIFYLDKHGWNSLRAAVYSQSYDTVEALLCSGVNIKSVCSAGISGKDSDHNPPKTYQTLPRDSK